MTSAGNSMLRLLTYNIHGCIGRGGKPDPSAILSVIREADADLVALQEVHGDDDLDRSFLRALERDLDYGAVIHGPTMRRTDASYGNVLLSRLPPDRVNRIDLSVPRLEPRGAIQVEFRHADREVNLIATHLGFLPGECHSQLRRLAAAFAAPQERCAAPDGTAPVRVLMGDLNLWFRRGPTGRLLRRLIGRPLALATFPARLPFLALDQIVVAPDDVRVNRQVLGDAAAAIASDHRPLVADLSW